MMRRSELSHTSRTRSQLHTCLEAITALVRHMMTETRGLEDSPMRSVLPHVDKDMQRLYPRSCPRCRTECSSMSAKSTLSGPERPLKRKREDRPSTTTTPIMRIADIFVERISSVNISGADVSSYVATTDIEIPSMLPYGENVSRAWEMCVSFARRSSQELRHGRFLRFLSLCFFLIWEKYSDKQGKSAAREASVESIWSPIAPSADRWKPADREGR